METLSLKMKTLSNRYPSDVKKHAQRVSALASVYGKDYALVGLLHDIIEDTSTTLDEIPEDIRTDIDTLTRRKNEAYFDYIHRIKNGSRRAILIKYIDIYDHLTHTETLKPSLKKRYEKAKEILESIDI